MVFFQYVEVRVTGNLNTPAAALVDTKIQVLFVNKMIVWYSNESNQLLHLFLKNP